MRKDEPKRDGEKHAKRYRQRDGKRDRERNRDRNGKKIERETPTYTTLSKLERYVS
jgi:hypothetical protein